LVFKKLDLDMDPNVLISLDPDPDSVQMDPQHRGQIIRYLCGLTVSVVDVNLPGLKALLLAHESVLGGAAVRFAYPLRSPYWD
jgi:hypothetical protein